MTWVRVSGEDFDPWAFIDGFDEEHECWAYPSAEAWEIVIYHNEGEPEGSDSYWGLATFDGDGDCDADLNTLMQRWQKK